MTAGVRMALDRSPGPCANGARRSHRLDDLDHQSRDGRRTRVAGDGPRPPGRFALRDTDPEARLGLRLGRWGKADTLDRRRDGGARARRRRRGHWNGRRGRLQAARPLARGDILSADRRRRRFGGHFGPGHAGDACGAASPRGRSVGGLDDDDPRLCDLRSVGRTFPGPVFELASDRGHGDRQRDGLPRRCARRLGR